MNVLTLDSCIDLTACLHGDLCRQGDAFSFLGESLGEWLAALLTKLGASDRPISRGRVAQGAFLEGRVFVDEGATIEPTAYVQGPCYIGPGAEVRHGAYIRGQVYIGPRAVVGHATEVKGSMFFDHAKAGHFAYVGDSILGRDTNLGAGTKLANLPLRRGIIKIRHPATGAIISTGLKKFGAIVGDEAQTGCNSVLSPGTILMPRTAVLPCVHFRGTLTEGLAR